MPFRGTDGALDPWKQHLQQHGAQPGLHIESAHVGPADKGPSVKVLTATKLRPPRLRAAHLLRPRLLARLDAGADSDVILICAPAGYGKTTLAADWLSQPGVRRAAWVSLDDGDNDLATYLRTVVAAVRLACRDEALCSGTYLLLEAAHTPAPSVYAETLIADLSELDTPLILALDDYHVLTDPAVREVMAALLRTMPPQLRLLLTTRRDPDLTLLAQLRARGRVTEIRAGDLRFVEAEARTVLEQAAGTTVSPQAAELLESGTEGWIIGLQLAGLSMRGQPDQLGFARAFREQGNRMVTEYLLDEVLARQPAPLLDFLLKTAILDRLSAGLCAALLEDPGGERVAQDHLDALAQANLFLTSLDPLGEWYRYHALFRSLLLRRLESELGTDEIARLHRRAGTWFAANHFTEEALRHLAAGGDVDGAANLVENRRHDVLNTQQVSLLERWLGLLPEAVVDARPALVQLKAWTVRAHFQLQAVVRLLDQAEALGPTAPGAADPLAAEILRGERDAMRSEAAFWQGDIPGTLALAQSALARLPVHFHMARGLPALYRPLSLHISGQTEQALALINAMLDDERLQHPSFKGRLLVAAGAIYGATGDLWRLQQASEHLLRISEADNQLLNLGWAHFFLGHVCYQYDRLEAAREHWTNVQTLRYHVHFRAYLDANLGLALVRQLQGDLPGAEETLAALAQVLLEMQQNQLAPELHAFRARLALLRGEVPPAVQWLETGVAPAHVPLWFWETSDLTRVKAYLARGNGADLQAAEALLDAGEQEAERTRHTLLLIQVWALRAVLATKQGRADDAPEAMRRALGLAEPSGYIRLFVDMGAEVQALLEQLAATGAPSPYLERLLEACGAQGTPAADLLSDRELEVLALLRDDLSDREIAQRLFLSVLTVKKHNRNIYKKLGVSDRQQAVTQASALGLLP